MCAVQGLRLFGWRRRAAPIEPSSELSRKICRRKATQIAGGGSTPHTARGKFAGICDLWYNNIVE